ncbi:innexin shaking-B [Nephila pilipes]|uniref:Innexin n=1 Tax=Nephila pilipes TaxID=299642 RepID=A0A8X6P1N3_NEPPI|nr:innexin shaking-B [Nephila pilipes]
MKLRCNVIHSIGSLAKRENPSIDYETLKLHYAFTVGVLLIFFIIVSIEQNVGDPILCEVAGGGSIVSINAYCWIHSTFVIPKAFNKEVNIEAPHPGIDSTRNPREYYFLKYYQWIYIMLLFQALLFYIPRWLWRTWEGGKMKILTKDLGSLQLPEPELNKKIAALSKYLVKTWATHNAYAAQYFFCELLALIIVLGQFYMLEVFFDGRFINFGAKIIEYFTSDEYYRQIAERQNIMKNPMIMLFPRVTKCIFRKYGESSTIENKDVLCVMPLNVINEKIFVFQWFWFSVLAILTALSLLMDLFLIMSGWIRVQALRSRFKLVDKKDLQLIVKKGSYGDWFIIDLIGRNIDEIIFKDLVTDVSKKLTQIYKNL